METTVPPTALSEALFPLTFSDHLTATLFVPENVPEEPKQATAQIMPPVVVPGTEALTDDWLTAVPVTAAPELPPPVNETDPPMVSAAPVNATDTDCAPTGGFAR